MYDDFLSTVTAFISLSMSSLPSVLLPSTFFLCLLYWKFFSLPHLPCCILRRHIPFSSAVFSPVLSYSILSRFILTFPNLQCLVLSPPVMICTVLSCAVLSFYILSCSIFACSILTCAELSCSILISCILTCAELSCCNSSLVVSCPILS